MATGADTVARSAGKASASTSGRPLDCFGVGCFFYDVGDSLQDAVASVGSFKDEQGVEACYAVVPVPWLRLTADVQWANPANGANGSTWLGGLRMRVEF
ncbi:MAG: carbohydrate porin [Betaproteobacteria bacterium]